MKIAYKISLLVLFLIVILACNTFIGVNQLANIGQELKDVVKEDITFKEVIFSVAQYQLEKSLLFERMIRIAEEVGFENTKPARRNYLLDHVKYIKEAFDQLSTLGAKAIMEGEEAAQKQMDIARSFKKKEKLAHIQKYFVIIEQAHIQYDQLIAENFAVLYSGDYQISLEDLDEVQDKERILSTDSKKLLQQVRMFTQESLVRAESYEAIARFILRTSFWMSIFISLIFTFLIIRTMSRPLGKLVLAAHKIGDGDFDVSLRDDSKDEIGEVSHAFNVMAKKINDVTSMLAKNLKITQDQKHDLEKVNRELDNFAHTVSHDIRAPLTGITGYAAYLERHYLDNLDQKGKTCVEGIRKGAKRLNHLIEDLLALTRISRVKNPFECVQPKELLDAVCEGLEYAIKENHVDMCVQDYIPVIVCDKIKMKEVFHNLINNAIKFSSKNNKKRPRIEVGYQEKDDFHEFYVKDNGIGIASEDHGKIFDIFQKVHKPSEYSGTGAGLSIVKRIIEDHDGTIVVESDLGNGACFRFTVSKGLELQDSHTGEQSNKKRKEQS
ncbi:MAG: HAMP domain-containing protein [Candidatus Omnitrophica bacterium]|nr:HAMP domain-containing protein [Candidatus Omnitrophota bacterium]